MEDYYLPSVSSKEIEGLTTSEMVTYIGIKSFCGDGRCWAGIRNIADRTKQGIATVSRNIKTLIKEEKVSYHGTKKVIGGQVQVLSVPLWNTKRSNLSIKRSNLLKERSTVEHKYKEIERNNIIFNEKDKTVKIIS